MLSALTLDTLAIDYPDAGLGISPETHPEPWSERGVQLLPSAVDAPDPEVIVARFPRREVARQHTPGTVTS